MFGLRQDMNEEFTHNTTDTAEGQLQLIREQMASQQHYWQQQMAAHAQQLVAQAQQLETLPALQQQLQALPALQQQLDVLVNRTC